MTTTMEIEIPDYMSFTTGPNPRQALLVDQRSNLLVKLNASGRLAWEALEYGDWPKIVRAFAVSMEVDDLSAAEGLLTEFVTKMRAEGWLAVVGDNES
jgi:hypothetical protein